MKEHTDATLTALVEAMHRNEPDTFIELVNDCHDLFGHDAAGHSLMWHARQSSNPVFAETLELLAAGKPFTEEAVRKPSAPAPAAPKPAPVLSEAELEPLLQQLRESLLHGEFLDNEAKKELASLPSAEICTYVTKNNLLFQAADKGCLPICELLLKVGIPVDSPHTMSEVTALHAAAGCGHLKLCELLLQHGASVAAKDGHGATALHCAVRCQKAEKALEICELLLQHGADVNARAVNSVTPLHDAAVGKDALICELLLKHGAEVNTKNSDENAPLHLAALYASPAICKALVDGGADIHALNNAGATPLHLAAFGHNGVGNCALLVEHGADVNARDYKGNTPMHYASPSFYITQGFVPSTRGAGGSISNYQFLQSLGASRFVRNYDGEMAIYKSDAAKICCVTCAIMGAIIAAIMVASHFYQQGWVDGFGIIFLPIFSYLGFCIGKIVAILMDWTE